jgi:5-methylcytosine-specific restriction protein A
LGFLICAWKTHHIIYLCRSGRDTTENVIGLCPQHHREAHYGANGELLEKEFKKVIARLEKT